MGVAAALGVGAMCGTFIAGVLCWLLAGVSDDSVAELAWWGSTMLYVWGFGVWGVTVVLGDYPYGKMAPGSADFGYFGPARSLLGTPIPPRIAWCLQEAPACIVPLICWATAERAAAAGGAPGFGNANRALLLMMIVHYFQRSFVYAARIRGSKGVPLSLMLCCFFFCAANGLLQGAALTRHYTWDDGHLLTPRFLCGACVWLWGMLVNWHADATLIALRKPGETGYKIPRGGAFEYVSGANFFGEIVEWYGWGIAGGHGTGVAFAVFTMFNIAPRACATHRWYLKKFPEYPKQRAAVVPLLF